MGRSSTCRYSTLGLWRVELTHKETAKVVRVLEKNEESLRSFILDSCSGYCDIILTTVLTRTHITTLQIHGESTGLYSLGMGLASTRYLKELEIADIWDWTSDLATALGKGLEHTTTLELLLIRDCDFFGTYNENDSDDNDDDGGGGDNNNNNNSLLFPIATGLRANRTLKRLKILSSQLSDAEGSNLFDSISSHPCLHSVSVNDNVLGCSTIEKIAHWMTMSMTMKMPQKEEEEKDEEKNNTKKCQLKHLDLGSQLHLHLEQNLLPFIKALAVNTSLQSLVLSMNKLEDSNIVDLWNALITNTTLEDLHLQYNNLSDDSIQMFCKSLPYMTSLRSIKLYGHSFDSFTSFKSLVKALEGNTSLEVASLGLCTKNRINDNNDNKGIASTSSRVTTTRTTEAMSMMTTSSSSSSSITTTTIQDDERIIRHYLNLNKAGRRICRNDQYIHLWPFVLERANILWKHDRMNNISVLFGLLLEQQPYIVALHCDNNKNNNSNNQNKI